MDRQSYTDHRHHYSPMLNSEERKKKKEKKKTKLFPHSPIFAIILLLCSCGIRYTQIQVSYLFVVAFNLLVTFVRCTLLSIRLGFRVPTLNCTCLDDTYTYLEMITQYVYVHLRTLKSRYNSVRLV